jgi:hypothetical protein
MREFFANDLNIDIDDRRYAVNGKYEAKTSFAGSSG